MKKVITGPSNNPRLPSIYQIETVSRCNFSCNFCQTGQFGGKVTKDSFIDLELVEKIVERDLAGSYFIELQHRGEPTLNKELDKIVKLLKPHVFLGLSTNGSLIHKHLETLLLLDYITISFDSGEKELYETLRIGGKWEDLIRNTNLLIEARGANPTPAIDLQLVQLHETPCQTSKVKQLALEKNWDVRVRSLQDCFLAVNHPDLYDVKSDELCINPFTSVSIHVNGNVVPCCRVWDNEWVYGNLYENSLEEIWNESSKVKEFRKLHTEDRENLPFFCKTCYAVSPEMLHFEFYKNSINRILKKGSFAEKEFKFKSAQDGVSLQLKD